MERGERAEKLIWIAQTNRKLFKYLVIKSVRGKQQERDVPLHEPHGRDELKFEYERHGVRVQVEFAECEFSGGWKDTGWVADWWIDDGWIGAFAILLSFNRLWDYRRYPRVCGSINASLSVTLPLVFIACPPLHPLSEIVRLTFLNHFIALIFLM
jgi:hypothetical protein